MTEQEIAKMRILKNKYTELFNEQSYSTRVLNIIMSEIAEIALLENQVKDIEERIKRRHSNILGLHKDYKKGKE